ncbi:Arc family DNA-binding protein [Streptomyces roseolus]|uniref:TA system antitoxin ParD family protein n=1 Tax=Streptomyces roseolus TaxID=67358 RepID=UPI0036F608EA
MINYTVRFPDDLYDRIRTQATADRRSIHAELLHLLEVGLSAVAPETPDRPGGDPATPAPLRGRSNSSPT